MPSKSIKSLQSHFNPIYNIPSKFFDRVCTCDTPEYTYNSKRLHITYCGNCNKPMRHYLRICSGCQSLYISDFRSTQNCLYVRHQRCFNCLPAECPEDCNYRDMLDIPPVGLNPKEFTDEELAGIFDFD